MLKASPSSKPTTAKKLAGRVVLFLAVLAGIFCTSAVFAPQVMAWPHKAQFGSSTVYAEQPIPPEMTATMAKADALIQQSAIYAPDAYATNIFVGDGGWRWRLATLGAQSGFAITRPWNNAIVINKTDMKAGIVNGVRTLPAIIAHERTHGLIFSHFGRLRAIMLPAKKVEGYGDYVAQESTLSDADYARLKQAGKTRPAMLYYEGRKLAEDALDRRKLTVDQFFAEQ